MVGYRSEQKPMLDPQSSIQCMGTLGIFVGLISFLNKTREVVQMTDIIKMSLSTARLISIGLIWKPFFMNML